MKQIMLFLFCFMSITLIASSTSEIEQLKREAAQGDAYSQVILANHYLLGNGVPKNVQRGLNLLEKASNSNDPDVQGHAQGYLASIYHMGEWKNVKVVKPDYNKARYWAEKAVNNNNGLGCLILSALYEMGRGGVTRDIEQARKLKTRGTMFLGPSIEDVKDMCEMLLQAYRQNDFNLLLQLYPSSTTKKYEKKNAIYADFRDGVNGIKQGARMSIYDIQRIETKDLVFHMFKITLRVTNIYSSSFEMKTAIEWCLIFVDGKWVIWREKIL